MYVCTHISMYVYNIIYTHILIYTKYYLKLNQQNEK